MKKRVFKGLGIVLAAVLTFGIASCSGEVEYKDRIVEVEKIVPSSTLPAGTYTVYHLQQKTTGGKAFADYNLYATESSKAVAADSTIENLKNSYTGFTAAAMAQNGSAVYVFYDRNLITVTFDYDGGTSATSGEKTVYEQKKLAGSDFVKPTKPAKSGYHFNYWTVDGVEATPVTTFTEDVTYKASYHQIVNYTVTYNSDHGNGSFSFPCHTRLGTKKLDSVVDGETTYYFRGWFKDAEFTSSASGYISEETTVYAKWSDVEIDYSACVVGDFILKDGTILSKDDTPESGTVAAVIVRVKTDDKPALGVGIVHNSSGLAWCKGNAAGYSTNITALQGTITSGYMDGSDGWEKLKAACSDAEAHPEYYPAWNYSLTYATTNNLTGDLADGWYLPTMAELYTIYQNKTTVDTSLTAAGGNTFGFSWYWSCCQTSSYDGYARLLFFFSGGTDATNEDIDGFSVCSVRAFN